MTLASPSNLHTVLEQAGKHPTPVVIDTNMVLDMLLFDVPEAAHWLTAIQAQQLHWLATDYMREELRRVLHYPNILARMHAYNSQVSAILDAYDTHSQTTSAAPRCCYICKDADDQCFIDLAAAHQAILLSKDTQVGKLRKRLAKIGVVVYKQW